ncbi:TraG family protein [Enterococcus faecium]|nr:TraG family protein [Enterococcus faecium]
MQLNADFVVTDPKGSILNELGVLLRAKENYDIRVLNLIDFSKSMHYNPLAYIKKEEDILKVVETIIKIPVPKTQKKISG